MQRIQPFKRIRVATVSIRSASLPKSPTFDPLAYLNPLPVWLAITWRCALAHRFRIRPALGPRAMGERSVRDAAWTTHCTSTTTPTTVTVSINAKGGAKGHRTAQTSAGAAIPPRAIYGGLSEHPTQHTNSNGRQQSEDECPLVRNHLLFDSIQLRR